MDSNKIFKQYGVIFENGGRYYRENLDKRDYNLEFTTPYRMTIFDTTIQESNWGEVIRSLAFLLLQKFPEKTASLLDFKSPWSNQNMFSATEKTNHKALTSGLYVNCNHTALHACWFIQDLLKFYHVAPSEVAFFIHRPPAAEPDRVKVVLKAKCQNNFRLFLQTNYNKSADSINIIINNIEKHLNEWLAQISHPYNDFFLFENATYIENYSKRVMQVINTSPEHTDKYKTICARTMSYLVEFYQLVGVQ